MGLESRRSPVNLVFESHGSPGKGGKFLLAYDSERHCESQVRFLASHKGVTAKTAETLMDDRTVWQITVDGLNVQAIESANSDDGSSVYRLTVPSSNAALRAIQCLGLPDTHMECSEDSVRWLIIVKSTFTQAELDKLAFTDVERAQMSMAIGAIPRISKPAPKPTPRINEEDDVALPQAPVSGPAVPVGESGKPKKTGRARAFMKRFGL
ncbi:hypothetical protein BDP55DRAFT_287588 [Colletotrichum godetiae]|uniref:Uncharacterized protein n=1 Tax=Colletotrichum godetiae TaxID=1209918 RepID=A0AAJ0AFL7_9PEZI|nr:uncharacterized protein BDP55DRAFT_287588 [Colletotrichum godetiae]KAK1671578.1 hypothetical protein BDP55DRAFT_287588 [Colletotrichum godetiae]